MLRKLIMAGGLLAVGSGLVLGTPLKSYLQTICGRVTDTVHEAVPIEFEIERARQMARDIMPEIRKNMQSIAREEVAIAQLHEQVNKLTDKQQRDRTELSKLKSDLDAGGTALKYGGRTYTVSQVKTDLSQRLDRCKTNDTTLDSLKNILTAREQGLEAARQKLDKMLVGKRQLETEVENLEARLKMLEVAQTASSTNLDDSQLGRVKELVSDLRSRLQVAEKMAQAEAVPVGEIPVNDETPTDIVDRVTEYLGVSPSPEKLVSKE